MKTQPLTPSRKSLKLSPSVHKHLAIHHISPALRVAMQRLILSAVIVLIHPVLLSLIQEPANLSDRGEIRGKVCDKKTKTILDYATLVLMKDRLVIASTASDSNGNYYLKDIVPGTYEVRVSYVGYKAYVAAGIEVKSEAITFWNIELEDMDTRNDLGEVTITNSRSTLISRDENKRTLYSYDIIKLPQRGTNAIRSTSSGVNTRGNVQFLGSRTDGTRIFIDGVPVIGNWGTPEIKNDDRNGREENGESYAKIHERGFLNPALEPLSTFSIDVDKASYSNTRRILQSGYLPAPDAVRIEEFINYFDYAYPEPAAGEVLAMHSQLARCPWSKEHYLLKIGLNAKKQAREAIQGRNLVFLIDVSGSMADYNKLPLVKKSLILLLDHLNDRDKVALVVYAGNSGLVLPSTSCSHKETIKQAISQLESGGSTAGGAGIQLAYRVAADQFIRGGINRVILATDGDFNVGVSSESALEDLIVEKRRSGIFLSVLGFGTGNYQDSKMEVLADKGNGNYAYIDNIGEARKILVTELEETLVTVARDVKIQIEFNPHFVESYRLIGYENGILNAEDFQNDRKDAGEMGSGSTVTALYEITPVDRGGRDSLNPDSLRYFNYLSAKANAFQTELAFLKLRYKNLEDSSSRLLTYSISNQLERDPAGDFNFAASLAQFAMLLRNSEYKGTASYDKVIKLARNAVGDDPEGERAEFIRLVSTARDLSKSITKTD